MENLRKFVKIEIGFEIRFRCSTSNRAALNLNLTGKCHDNMSSDQSCTAALIHLKLPFVDCFGGEGGIMSGYSNFWG